MRHKRVYEMLKASGHSPITALQIIVEARRGDKWALQWIKLLRKQHAA